MRTFEDFWPFYVGQHRRHGTRVMHFVGTTLGLAAAYGFAGAGHYFIEKNRPATFTYPLWSFLGDLRMYWLMWQGNMTAEVERLGYGPAPISA
jgi:hypothetical protein